MRRSISLTGQFAAVDDVLSGRENLELIGRLRHVSSPADTATKLLQQFDLVDAGDRRALTYSGGMRRRLDIAMSLIGKPEIIFLDEPTTGLDPQSRNQMWEQIRSLAAQGTTIFLTTQYLEEADQLADQIAVLAGGTIVAEGTPAQLKSLVPHNTISLRFTTAAMYRKAQKQLSNYTLASDDESYSLAITIENSASQLATLFSLIDRAHIDIAEFSQKTPTLDDAFLKIINDTKGANS